MHWESLGERLSESPEKALPIREALINMINMIKWFSFFGVSTKTTICSANFAQKSLKA